MKFEFTYEVVPGVTATGGEATTITRVYEAASWFEALGRAQHFFRCERSALTWREIETPSPISPTAGGGAGVIDNRKAPGA